MKSFLAVLLLVFSAPVFAQPFEPVNKNATEEARKLLAYLYEIDDEYIIAGQHNYNHELNRYSEDAKEIAGVYPALWGTDFIGAEDNERGQEIVDEAIKKWNEGYIVTLMWHAGRPMDNPPYGWRESIQGELTDEEWAELTTPGTELNLRWQKQVDQVAALLAQLRDAGVPILWRPYHEMNGIWFWWGDKKGPDGFAKLWKMMYDRYVNVHHLDNLLWVWNANAPRDIPFDQAYSYRDYYPGHEYVDILATDVYHFDYEQKDYEELLALAEGRPVALGEVGELPKMEILEVQPAWTWFMVWSNFITTDNPPQRVKQIYNHPSMLTHGEIKLFE